MTTKIDFIPNEIALEQTVFGTEAVRGVAVTPTGRLMGQWSSGFDLIPHGAIIEGEQATGTFDRTTTAAKRQQRDPSGTYTEDASFETLASLFRYGVAAIAAPTSDGEGIPGYTYSFVPHSTQDTMDTFTVQTGQVGYAVQGTGVRWTEWTLSWDATNTQNTAWQWSSTAMAKDGDLLPGFGPAVATGGTQGVNEVQELAITGTPDGGTFTLSFRGATTSTIAYNAVAGDVESALEGLSTIGAGNVAVAGDALPSNAQTITFTGDLGFQDVPLIVANGAGLTGGSAPAAAVTEDTPGSGEGTIIFSGESFGTDEWQGNFAFIDFGSHIGPVRQILENDGTTLSLSGPALPVAPTGLTVYIGGMIPALPDPGYHTIEGEGTEFFLDPYDANSSNLGDTDISDRVLSYTVTSRLNLANKRRASGISSRMGRGQRNFGVILRVELDHPDEIYKWRTDELVSLRIRKRGPVIDPSATPSPTEMLARLDFECLRISEVTPDEDNNNRTISVGMVGINDGNNVFAGTVKNTLASLP